MKIKKYIFILFFLSNIAVADPYMILSAQATTGQNDLYRSTSALANIGLGYETDFDLYIDWVLGVNAEVITEVILDDDFIDINQQSGQMDVVVGYKFKVSNSSYLKLGAGIETAIFQVNCFYSFVESKNVCDKKHEHGPTYKLGYFVRSSSKLLLGLEFNRDELSTTRKYNGLSFVINAKY